MGSLHTPVKNFRHFFVEFGNGISPTTVFDLILRIWQAVTSIACQFVDQIKFNGIKIADIDNVTSVATSASQRCTSCVPL
jgi:hypothetical protein